MTDVYYVHRTNLNFYCDSLFGARTLSIPDPTWQRPKIEVADPAWSRPYINVVDPEWEPGEDQQPPPFVLIPDEAAIPPLVTVPDMNAVHPRIDVPNPECKLPPASDLLQISEEEYSLFTRAAAYAIEGKVLGHSKDGEPAVVDRPAETEAMLAATALSRRDRLLASATAMMDPLQDAVDIGDSTEAEEAELVAWKRYRVQLKRVEQQPGFPTVIEWPSRPEEVSP